MNEQRAFTPSPEQLNQWREEFCTAFNIRLWELTPSGNFSSVGLAREWNGYIRARTDQATEIADLMPLAKFGAKILKTKALFDVDAETFAFSLGLIEWLGSSLADPTIKPNIEATLEQLLKDTP